MAAMVVVAMLSALLNSGRLSALATGVIAQWAGLALVTRDPVSFIVMVIGAAAGVWTIRFQLTVNRGLQEQQEQADRTQQRAELILSDFEQTRQGWFWETDRRGAITYVSPTVSDVIGHLASTWWCGHAGSGCFY